MFRFKVEHGFSLIEALITILVISIALAGVLMAININVAHSAGPMIRTQAYSIAGSYLDEIMAKSYSALPNPPGRPKYNDVDDYNGLVNNGAQNQFGQPIAGLGGYKVSVVVTSTSLQGAPAKRVSVTVSHGLFSVTIPAYRLQIGP